MQRFSELSQSLSAQMDYALIKGLIALKKKDMTEFEKAANEAARCNDLIVALKEYLVREIDANKDTLALH